MSLIKRNVCIPLSPRRVQQTSQVDGRGHTTYIKSLNEDRGVRGPGRNLAGLSGQVEEKFITITMWRLLLYDFLWCLSIVAVSGDNIGTSKSTTASPPGTHAVTFGHRLYKTAI